VGDATDAPALTKAFKGAEAAYVMVPPNPTSISSLARHRRPLIRFLFIGSSAHGKKATLISSVALIYLSNSTSTAKVSLRPSVSVFLRRRSHFLFRDGNAIDDDRLLPTFRGGRANRVQVDSA
jgi:hypothetical protein